MVKSKFWNNSIKSYAKKYKISVLDENGHYKSVNQLSNEIYEYEKENRPKNPLFPFLDIKDGFLV
jgi:hypothetical protein